jgi:hypothetical protein
MTADISKRMLTTIGINMRTDNMSHLTESPSSPI